MNPAVDIAVHSEGRRAASREELAAAASVATERLARRLLSSSTMSGQFPTSDAEVAQWTSPNTGGGMEFPCRRFMDPAEQAGSPGEFSP